MQKSALKRFIGWTLLVAIGMALTPVVLAQTASLPPASRAVQACLSLKPTFRAPEKAQVKKAFAFRALFEQTRNAYHAYLQCILDGAVKEIYGSTGINVDEIFGANTPNLPDLLSPDATCLDPNVMIQLAESTSPDALLPSLLEIYNAYSDHLTVLYQEHQRYSISAGRSMEEDYVSAKQMEWLVKNEIQDALVGLHTALKMFNELRQIFIMHVHFQCMLKNLEEYRQMLGELRKIIFLLPRRIIDASMTK